MFRAMLVSIGAAAIAAFALVVLLSGCSTPEETEIHEREVAAFNAVSLQHPEVVGKLPDGQTLSVVVLRKANPYELSGYATHYVYTAANTPVTTANYEVRHGKSRRNEVQVFINGVKYVAKPEEAKNAKGG